MSWADWVNGYIINHTDSQGETTLAICRRGIIAALADGTTWGETNFQFLEYDLELEDDNGGVVKGKVNEFNNLKTCWDNKGRKTNFGGIRFNNESFRVSKFDEDTNTMYLTGQDKGCCVAKSEQCWVIGVYYKAGELQTTSGKTRNYSAGNANAAVENCRDKLVEAGF